MKKLALLFVLIITTAACENLTGPDEDNISFESRRIDLQPGMGDTAEVFAGQLRSIEIDGVIVLPDQCYALVANQTRTGAQIDVTINATRASSTCTTAIQAMEYAVAIFAVPSGVFRVRVFHKVNDNARQVVAQQDVTVR